MSAGFARISKDMFGPWALITGASSGIGAEFARQLAANGFNLVLAARRLPLLEQAGTRLAAQYGITYRTIQVDLADPGFLAAITSATDDLDIGLVISNAGDMIMGEFLDSEPGMLFADMRLNVASHLGLTHHFGRRLAQRGGGGILLISSTAALQPVPYTASYAAAKSYLLSLGEAAHYELARHGVTVTVLLPGATDTAMVARFSDTTGISVHKPPMSLMLMTPGQLVSEGLGALRTGRARRIAGRANRATAALTPRRIRTRMFTAMSKKATQAHLTTEHTMTANSDPASRPASATLAPVAPSLMVKVVMRPMTLVLNPLIGRMAGRRNFPMAAQIRHVGRRSGRAYVTSAGARVAGDVAVVPLAFGNQCDWARNVRAADGCSIRANGQNYLATKPEFLDRQAAAPLLASLFSPADRAFFRLLSVKQYLSLRVAPTDAAFDD